MTHHADATTASRRRGRLAPTAVKRLARPGTAVAALAVVALTIADLAQRKFGGDSVLEMKRNFDGYIEQMRSF